MNHLNLYTSLFLALLLSTLFSCQKLKNPALGEIQVPRLLDRNEGLGSDEERQWISQNYQNYVNQIKLNQGLIPPRLRLAELFMMEARVTGEHGHYFPAALNVLEGVLTLEPNDDERFQALSLKASVLLSLHDFAQALEVAEKAVSLNPQNAQIHGVLVDAYVELGQYEKAVAMADRMVSIRPDLRSYSRISYLREIYGQTEGAIEAMRLAVSAAYPGTEDWAWAQLTLGALYENYGTAEQAKEVYAHILQVRRNYPFAMAALGRLHRQAGNLISARRALEEASALIPEVGFYQEMALLRLEKGDQNRANQTIREILKMLADDEANGHKMGLAYAEVYLDLMARPEKALPFAQKEYQARPENIEVNLLLSRIYQALGQTDRAKKHLVVAQKTGSKNPALTSLVQELKFVAVR